MRKTSAGDSLGDSVKSKTKDLGERKAENGDSIGDSLKNKRRMFAYTDDNKTVRDCLQLLASGVCQDFAEIADGRGRGGGPNSSGGGFQGQ